MKYSYRTITYICLWDTSVTNYEQAERENWCKKQNRFIPVRSVPVLTVPKCTVHVWSMVSENQTYDTGSK